MGITSFSTQLIEKYFNGGRVCELGAQNMYDKDYGHNFPYAKDYYLGMGAPIYDCIDLSGENGAITQDLSKPLDLPEAYQYEFVTNFGTSEHVAEAYGCFKNIHNLVVKGGIVICENPKTGNWPKHGFHYMTKEFYTKLAELCGYEILELGEHAAMGNITDGWNVYCVWRKTKDEKFISKAKFKELDLRAE